MVFSNSNKHRFSSVNRSQQYIGGCFKPLPTQPVLSLFWLLPFRWNSVIHFGFQKSLVSSHIICWSIFPTNVLKYIITTASAYFILFFIGERGPFFSYLPQPSWNCKVFFCFRKREGTNAQGATIVSFLSSLALFLYSLLLNPFVNLIWMYFFFLLFFSVLY